jgi:hypothetical protein
MKPSFKKSGFNFLPVIIHEGGRRETLSEGGPVCTRAAAIKYARLHIADLQRGKARQTVTINEGQRLFVIPCGGGFSCLGFDVERRKTAAICKELNRTAPVAAPGTLDAYGEYGQALQAAKDSGKRLKCGLHPRLIGLEGKRVECTLYGEKVRFIVGKSTGFIPCHLQIERRGNTGGGWISEASELGSIKILS